MLRRESLDINGILTHQHSSVKEFTKSDVELTRAEVKSRINRFFGCSSKWDSLVIADTYAAEPNVVAGVLSYIDDIKGFDKDTKFVEIQDGSYRNNRIWYCPMDKKFHIYDRYACIPGNMVILSNVVELKKILIKMSQRYDTIYLQLNTSGDCKYIDGD